MIKRLTILVTALFCFIGLSDTPAQNIEHKVFLLGNITDIDDKEAFASNFINTLNKTSSPYTILVNGDIINSKPTNENTEALKRLFSSINKASKGKIIIVPGDRDWDDSSEEGWKAVKKLEKIVKDWDLDKVKWPNDDACPGPKDIELSANLLLITIDTQWWNHPYRKTTPADADCKITTTGDYLEEFTELLDENSNKNILIAGHHPLISMGHYGGRFNLKDWLWPVPVAKGLIISYRQNIGRTVDLSNENYSPFAHIMTKVLRDYNSVIYASTHEKNQEIIKAQDNIYINSGSLGSSDYLAKNPPIPFATEEKGYMVINYFKSGKITSDFIALKDQNSAKEIPLFASSCLDMKDSSVLINHRSSPCKEEVTLPGQRQDTAQYVMRIAGPEYRKDVLYKLFFGQHYRSSWLTPVKAPYLHLDTTFQGLTPYAVGGGRQTTSLKLKGGNGKEYTFRSVNKDPIKALPYELRGTIVSNVLRDQTTTEQPYGAMASSIMLDEIGILHPRPTLYVLPESPQLGKFSEKYTHLLGMLEEKPINPDKVEIVFGNGDDVKHSLQMFRDLYEDNDNRIAENEFIRARVFDILVGDWGKHEDNWKWIGYDQEKGTLYRPVPRDRDHVFSKWDGIIPWLADREWAKASGENFDYEIKGMRSLMWQARHMDRALANESTKEDWIAEAQYIQNKITDDIIHKAVLNMPEEIYNPDGKEIEDKLKARIRDLDKYAEEYYLMLAKEVNIIGSEKHEYFDVVRNENGSVDVTVHKMLKDGEKVKILYHRLFHPEETKEIHLFGLDGEDVFKISGDSKKPSILVRVIPGPGKDTFEDTSSATNWSKQTIIYDLNENPDYALGSEAKMSKSKNPDAYVYNRTAFKYETYLPLAYLSYNADNGVSFNAGIRFTQQKYGKSDFSSTHFISASATTIGNLGFKYEGRWKYTFGKWDTYLDAEAGVPNKINYYFGRGNDTPKTDDLMDANYYNVQYNTYNASIGLVRDFLKFSNFKVGIGYEHNSEQLKENNIYYANPESAPLPGSDDQSFFTTKAKLNLDFRDRPNLSLRGMRFFVDYTNGSYINNSNYDNFGLAYASLEQFMSNYWENPLTLGLKIGGSTSFGDIPFYNLKYLGQNNDLRGYRRNRFTGESTAFFNSEVRMQLFQRRTQILPIKVGLRGFVDSGRVFDDLDVSNKWHTGYGMGFYLVPLQEKFTLNLSVAFSEEESGLILFSLGNVFN
ncbi:BamA/TamA family outer membrane protein [Fulvivirga sediminis]|uniref:BamA/TamA family outer membrane protein n=1 Tax=Fulvivirga sediminis TaxID=2803949 RepID=A0A937F4P1_9BACT|nr:metallophosphoesterase [Fulvivirga sediminis]MBL3654644.1 BamA/TamA family outer membrane protein [Fulvivirga sediminis]